ncbi:uncharacterized protein LOC143858248 [Tasmannia lanceolata]|uniref:uncharacterized protein LOC143858248 n=1 Tax=Tasmannia lanceolata TaxID=3420 RepID=UPI00406318AE
MKVRRDQGLCFNCDEKFVPGHRCKTMQVFILAREDDETTPDDEGTTENEDNIPKVSLYALASVTSAQTMRLQAFIKKQVVSVLIDTDSTHNFVAAELVQRLGYSMKLGPSFEVLVANGNKLRCHEICERVCINLGGLELITDLYALPLHGSDIVLGVQWLKSLGEQHTLRGIQNSKVQTVEGKELTQLLKQKSWGFLAQIDFNTQLEEGKNTHEDLAILLEEYHDVFQEPKGLPPHHSHDHHIPLKSGAQPVNVRPYRYPHLQKMRLKN